MALNRTVNLLYHVVNGVKRPGPNPAMKGNFIRLYGDCTGLSGNFSGLFGDCTGLIGHCPGRHTEARSGLFGNCTGLSGDLDDCIIPEGGCNICDLVSQ